MEMNFSIGEYISLDFSIGGGAPTPHPAPVTVYDNWRPVFTNVLTGRVATYEEVENNGD